MGNAASESSREKPTLRHLTQYAGLDFYQVFNLHGTINCRRVLPGYAISESAPGGVNIFVFPVNCARLPLFGFLPCTNAGWALQPGLTQSLRSCREGRHPPHHLQATKELSNPTVFLNYIPPTFASQHCHWQPRLPKEGLVHSWHGRRCAVAVWALGWRLFQVHFLSVLSQKCFRTALQNTWWHVPK